MYKLKIEDINSFYHFLKLNAIEYIDAFLNKGDSIMVSNTNEVFAYYSFKTDAGINSSGDIIRLPRKDLINLTVEGSIIVDVDEDKVILSFYDGTQGSEIETCSVQLNKQLAFTATYERKLDLIQRFSDYDKFRLEDFGFMCKIGRNTGSIISINNGLASIALSGNSKIFKEVPEDLYFAVSASVLGQMLSVSSTIYNIENYLGVYSKRYLILANKCRGDLNDDYKQIINQKSSFEFRVDLTSVKNFLSKMHPSDDALLIDADNGYCDFIDGSKTFRVPVHIKDVKKIPDTIGAVKFPLYLFKEVFSAVNVSDVYLSKKKFFTKLKIGNLILVY